MVERDYGPCPRCQSRGRGEPLEWRPPFGRVRAHLACGECGYSAPLPPRDEMERAGAEPLPGLD